MIGKSHGRAVDLVVLHYFFVGNLSIVSVCTLFEIAPLRHELSKDQDY